MIIEIVLLLLPGIVSIVIFSKLEKMKWKISTVIEYYARFSFIIYFLNSTIVYLRGWEEYSIRNIGLIAQLKYGVLSIFWAVVLPFVMWILKTIYNAYRDKLNEGFSLQK